MGERFIGGIINNRKFVIIISLLLALIWAALSFVVTINYDIYDYLPEETNSVKGADIQSKYFSENVPNVNILVSVKNAKDVTAYRERLEKIKGLSNITSVDDNIDVSRPLNSYTKTDYEDYYTEGAAFNGDKNKNVLLINAYIETDYAAEDVSKIEEVIGENGYLTGDVVDDLALQEASSSNTTLAMFILIPVILLILFLITKSFFAPFLVLLTIGLAVLMNMGTNIFLKDISYVTLTVSPVLQFAVSLDYSIFLLFSYNQFREDGLENTLAMKRAVRATFPVVVSCGLTTIFGFIALCFMKFGVGANLGFGLGKGVLFSMLASLIFLPCITLVFTKLIDKTKINFKKRPETKRSMLLPKAIMKLRLPIFLIVIIILLPSFIASNNAELEYGAGSVASTPDLIKKNNEVSKLFPQDDPMIIFFKSGNLSKENELSSALKNVQGVTTIVSYQEMVGGNIPAQLLTNTQRKNFYSNGWTRIILFYDKDYQPKDSFEIFENVRSVVKEYYPHDSYVSGGDPIISDLKDVASSDNRTVNIVVVIAIFLIILLTFRSIIMPVILVSTIEVAIWINFAIPYFTETKFMFIGYILISTVLLGATVDYAILFANRYLKERREFKKKDAILLTIKGCVEPISLSALVLTSAGVILAAFTDNGMIGELGFLLARGTVLAFFMVIVFLPAALYYLDFVIRKTSIGYTMKGRGE